TGIISFLWSLYILYSICREEEKLWGSWRCIVLFLFTDFGASCLTMTRPPPFPLAGLMGPLYGMIGAQAAFVLFNGRYLHAADVRRMWQRTVWNVVFLGIWCFAFIGMQLFGDFGLRLLGIAGIGALVGMLLSEQRFAPSPWNWVTLPILALLPVAGVQLIQ